jgi:LAO/AO transport system kinase
MNLETIRELILQAEEGEKFPLAKLISEIEKKDSLEFRKILFQELNLHTSLKKNSLTIGFTGTPGSGKSSLIGELCQLFLKNSPRRKKLAILAIDPSSKLTGGSILGDRTRVVLPLRENRVFFRSQASQLDLGGVNPYTYHVIRLLRYFFDYIFIETVGIGQNETEVSGLADFSFLILQPLAGDNIQFMKSGIMEVPDAFIINKCDEKELAMSSFHTLISSLEFLKDTLNGMMIPKIFQTSALKKIGLDTLLNFILHLQVQRKLQSETIEQLKKLVLREFGNFGLNIFLKEIQLDSKSFEELETEFFELIRTRIQK